MRLVGPFKYARSVSSVCDILFYNLWYLYLLFVTFLFTIFSRGHATLHLAVSLGPSIRPSVRPSVGPSHFWIASGFCFTAPAQPSATGLPCIRPCLNLYLLLCYFFLLFATFVLSHVLSNFRPRFVCSSNHPSIGHNFPFFCLFIFWLLLPKCSRDRNQPLPTCTQLG